MSLQFYDPVLAVDSQAGNGKTHAVIEFMTRDLRQNFIYVAPTIALLGEVETALKERDPSRKIYATHSSNAGGIVSQQALGILNGNDQVLSNTGIIVLLTHPTFLRILHYIEDKEHWHVFIDEAVQVYQTAGFHDAKYANVLTDLLAVKEFDDGKQYIEAQPGMEAVVAQLGGLFPDTDLIGATDRPIGATHDRPNGATFSCGFTPPNGVD